MSIQARGVAKTLSKSTKRGYREIHAVMKSWLDSGKYPPGARLPAEERLAEDFGVSRVTVRRAIDLLKLDDRVRRQRGAGTFVCSDEPQSAVIADLSHYARQTLDTMDGIVNRVLSRADVPVPAQLRDLFPESENPTVAVICILRLLHDEPFCYLESVVANWAAVAIEGLVDDLGRARLIDKMFALHGIRAACIRQSLSARIADAKLAKLLRVSRGDPLITATTEKCDGQKRTFQRVVAVSRTDTPEYQFEFVGTGYP